MRIVWIATLLFVSTLPSGAMNWSEADMDTLLYHAQRYGDTEVRRTNKAEARAELFARGPDALRFLMARVHIENLWIRILAQQLISELDDDEALKVLRDFIDAEHASTRRIAVFFMSMLKPEALPADLIPVLRARIDDEKEGGAAIRVLGKWRVLDAVPDIIAATDHEKERRRILAVNALRDIGDERAVPALIARLDDDFFTVRYPAARALASLESDVEPALRAALEHATARQRRHLERLLADGSCQFRQME